MPEPVRRDLADREDVSSAGVHDTRIPRGEPPATDDPHPAPEGHRDRAWDVIADLLVDFALEYEPTIIEPVDPTPG